ncbi:MAG: hypothetical protein FWH10_02420 [Oscillospiraceae bacterium]|nr:hypothetical protein [Oscillospiraceae bacterium]
MDTNFINADNAMARLNNNRELYLKLLIKAGEDINSMLADLLEKINTAAAAVRTAEESAHALKGVAANLSLDYLKSGMENADIKLKNGDININPAELKLAVSRTIEAVNSWIEENS